MLLDELAATSEQVAATRSRREKVALLADALRRAGADEAEVAATYLGGSIRQPGTGVGWRSLGTLPAPASAPTLTLP